MTNEAEGSDTIRPTAVPELTPEDVGCWLVTTQGSKHVFDLDAGTYQRLPGRGRGGFSYDTAVLPLGRIERWPVAGGTFLIWFDDPARPDELEHWRQSSTIKSIESFDDMDPDDEEP